MCARLWLLLCASTYLDAALESTRIFLVSLQKAAVFNTKTLPSTRAHDLQTFAEKLFSRLQTGNETFDTRMAILLVVSRVIGVHK